MRLFFAALYVAALINFDVIADAVFAVFGWAAVLQRIGRLILIDEDYNKRSDRMFFPEAKNGTNT